MPFLNVVFFHDFHCFFIHVLFSVVLSFIREFPSFSLILLACIILFVFISWLIGMNPDSFSSIVVGVPWGRFMIIFRVVLNIICISSSSFFVGFHASDPYVKIGMMVASMHCQMAFILIPLNSLSPVSASILWVAAIVLVSRSFRCSSRLPFVLYIFPRYLYLGTSSSIVLFSMILLSWPGPIFTTLHYAAPNSIWYFFATWFVISNISGRVVRSWWMRHTSSIHSRVFSWVPCFVCRLILFFLLALWLFRQLGLRILLPTGLLLV